MQPLSEWFDDLVYKAFKQTSGVMQTILWPVLLATILLSGCARHDAPAVETLDIVLAGGDIYSGLDAGPIVADVGIVGDKIFAIGDLSSREANTRIDVAGLAVTPGFIDLHNHAIRLNSAGSGIYRWPDAENLIRQGVTTVIGGPDGSSPLPLQDDFAALEASPASVNYGSFVGHGSIRRLIVGEDDRLASEDELQLMREQVDRAMQSGAFGLSSGLLYVPGSFAPTEEVIELAKVAAGYGGIYISHMRNEGRGVLTSVEETIRIGEEGGLPTQITHHKVMGEPMWGSSVQALALVDAAIERGVDVSSDQYPYTASSTGLSAAFPRWSLDGDRATRHARLEDPETREQIRQEIVVILVNDRGGDDPARVALADCPANPELNGLNLAEVLQQQKRDVSIDVAAELIIELQLAGGCSAVYHAMSMQDIERIMQHPKTMIASDGGIIVPGVGVPHPRNYGAFARVLAYFVREREVLSFTTAINKMSLMPAERIRLNERGRVTVGAYADLAVFDRALITDTATFENPHQYATGMQHVFVNGQAVLQDGKMTGARPGRVLRSTTP